MSENLFEKLQRIEENQEKVQQQMQQDKEDILSALSKQNPPVKHTSQAAPSQKASADPAARAAVQKQNQMMDLRNFLKTSYKEHLWVGNEDEFQKERTKTLLVLIGTSIVMLICTIVTTACLSIYSTFTLFENIWLLLTMFLIKYVYKAQRHYSSEVFSDNSCFRWTRDADGVLQMGIIKKKYKAFFWIAVICAFLNMVSSWMMDCSAPLLVTVLELATIGAIGYSVWETVGFFAGYGPIRFSGKNQYNSSKVVLIYSDIDRKLYVAEDYYKQFTFVK